MESATSLQELICKTACKFELNLNDSSSLRLETLRNDTVTLQRVSENFLLIGCYVDFQDGKLTGDPEFMIFIDSQGWFPIGVSEPNMEWIWGAKITQDGLNIINPMPEKQRKIAQRCEAWVQELGERNGSNECLIPAWLA